MKLKEKFAQKMLNEKLDFLPLAESIELFESGAEIETKFSWVINIEELGDDVYSMSTEELLAEYEEVFGDDDYGLRVGKSDDEFSEFTLEICPAPTYIDLIK